MIATPYLTRGSEISLDGLSLRVVGPIPGSPEVGSQDEKKFLLDVPATYGPFHGGMGATEYHIPGMYAWGEFIDTFSCPGVALPAGHIEEITDGFIGYWPGVTGAFEIGSDWLFVCGIAAYRCAGGVATSVTLDNDFGSIDSGQSRAANVTEFNGYWYVGTERRDTGAISRLWRVATGGGAWASSATVLRKWTGAIEWAPTGTSRFTLVGVDGGNTIKWTYGDPFTAGDWFPVSPAPSVPIGSSGRTIFSVICAPQHVYFGKQDGIFDLRANGRAPNLTPHWKTNWDISNGAHCAILENYIYASMGHVLERVSVTGERQDVPEPCGPGQDLPFTGPIYGRATAMTTWRGWLVVGFHNAHLNKTYVMFGRDRLTAGVDGPGPMLWHGAYAVLDGRTTHIQVHSPPFGTGEGQQYLWMFTADDTQSNENAAYHVYRQSLPKAANSLQELRYGGHHRFYDGDAKLYLADGWPQHPTAQRDVWHATIEAHEMTGTPSVTLYGNKNNEDSDADGEKDYTQLGFTITNGATTMYTPKTFGPAARVQFRVDLTGSPTNPPALLNLRVRADVNFPLSDIRVYTVDLRDDQSTTLGTADPRQAYARLQTLKRMVGQASTQVAMVDEYGISWQVRLLDLNWEERLADQTEINLIAKLTVRMLYRSGVAYDSGDLYNDGNPYGGTGP